MYIPSDGELEKIVPLSAIAMGAKDDIIPETVGNFALIRKTEQKEDLYVILQIACYGVLRTRRKSSRTARFEDPGKGSK